MNAIIKFMKEHQEEDRINAGFCNMEQIVNMLKFDKDGSYDMTFNDLIERNCDDNDTVNLLHKLQNDKEYEVDVIVKIKIISHYQIEYELFIFDYYTHIDGEPKIFHGLVIDVICVNLIKDIKTGRLFRLKNENKIFKKARRDYFANN